MSRNHAILGTSSARLICLPHLDWKCTVVTHLMISVSCDVIEHARHKLLFNP